jgi:tetratricopeptide (TPR) repeat protein
MRRLAALLCAVLILARIGPAAADQTDKRLDGLFAALKTTKDPAEGQAITDQIWQIWYETDDPEVRALLAAGEQAMQDGNPHDALVDFGLVIQAAPRFAEGWNRRATLNYLIGDYDASVQDIEQVLALEPRHFGALSGLGLIYVKLGDDAASLKAFKRALEINPFLTGTRDNVEQIEKRLKGKPI